MSVAPSPSVNASVTSHGSVLTTTLMIPWMCPHNLNPPPPHKCHHHCPVLRQLSVLPMLITNTTSHLNNMSPLTPLFQTGWSRGHTCSLTFHVFVMTLGHPSARPSLVRYLPNTVHLTKLLVTSSYLNFFNSRDYFSIVLPTNPVLTNICPKPFRNTCLLDKHLLDHLICHRRRTFVMT